MEGLTLVGAKISKETFGYDEFKWDGEVKIYMQETDVCEFWFNKLKDHEIADLLNSTEDSYKYLFQFLNSTDACEQFCNVGEFHLICHPHKWQDGYCDSACNKAVCNYDGGDCNQLCDFDECDYTMWTNNECDEECFNYDCGFDFCSCSISIGNVTSPDPLAESLITNDEYSLYQDECVLNVTKCMIETDFKCKENWLGDGYCDDWCDNEYCRYDMDDCDSECIDVLQCYSLWYAFDLLANYITTDYFLDTEEACALWPLLTASVILPENADWNCTTLILDPKNDLNGDSVLNPFEAMSLLMNHSIQSTQVNCSWCFPSVDIYYANKND